MPHTLSMDFDTAFATWLTSAQAIVDEHMSTKFPTLAREVLTTTQGKRYIKVVKRGSVFCFVDKTDGNVYKAASWKAPALHARGNIFTPEKGTGTGPYGALYL